jgi:thiol-disulfide isomerase/thioredoxin
MLPRLLAAAFAGVFAIAAAGQTAAPTPAPSSRQTRDAAPPARSGQAAKKAPDSEAELETAIGEAGNDRAALVRNLEAYLHRFPDTPHKADVYRALVESSMQLRNSHRALEYAERLIALRPDDTAMMLFAVDLLERAGDDQSLTRAVGYTTRVLDRVEKPVAGKPGRVSQTEWEAQQKAMRMSVYLIRGRLQMERRDYDLAIADLEASYRLVPNASAVLHLGEIAELRKDYDRAIERYVAAFVLPDRRGQTVDRWEVRRKLGNLWRLTHGSEAGLGERLLAAYDRLAAEPRPAESAQPNKGSSEPYDFVLRRLDGSAPFKLGDWKGKVVVLNFWATWCLPCRELEPLFEQVGRQFEDRSDVVFLAVNDDEDEGRVAPYVERQKVRATVVFADGLEQLLDIKSLPTVIVLDRAGKIVYRAQGFAPEGFVEALSAAIEGALAGAD